MRSSWVVAAIILASLRSAAAQPPAASPVERFDRAVHAATDGQSIGLAVAVTDNGEGIDAKAFGPPNVETGQLLTRDSLWTSSLLTHGGRTFRKERVTPRP
jgi:CubicO group peptidase (beta-lactamase class C family)